MALEIRLNSVPHFKALLMVKTYLVGKGIVEHLGSFIYCQITLILIHKRAYRSSIYWSQCMSKVTII